MIELLLEIAGLVVFSIFSLGMWAGVVAYKNIVCGKCGETKCQQNR